MASKSSGVKWRPAVVPGVDRLIPLPVLELRLDVGRQRHLAQPLQNLQKDSLISEADEAVAAFGLSGHLRRQFAVSEGQLGSGANLPAGPYQTLPGPLSPVGEQQNLAGAAAGKPLTQKPGRQNSGVV